MGWLTLPVQGLTRSRRQGRQPASACPVAMDGNLESISSIGPNGLLVARKSNVKMGQKGNMQNKAATDRLGTGTALACDRFGCRDPWAVCETAQPTFGQTQGVSFCLPTPRLVRKEGIGLQLVRGREDRGREDWGRARALFRLGSQR